MNTQGQDNAKRFVSGIVRHANKRLVRHLIYLVSQGRWGSIVELARALRFPVPLTVADLKAVIDPKGKLTGAVIFQNQLAANRTLRKRVAAVPKGDWNAVCDIARAEGLEISPDELKASVPDSFRENSGTHPKRS